MPPPASACAAYPSCRRTLRGPYRQRCRRAVRRPCRRHRRHHRADGSSCRGRSGLEPRGAGALRLDHFTGAHPGTELVPLDHGRFKRHVAAPAVVGDHVAHLGRDDQHDVVILRVHVDGHRLAAVILVSQDAGAIGHPAADQLAEAGLASRQVGITGVAIDPDLHDNLFCRFVACRRHPQHIATGIGPPSLIPGFLADQMGSLI
ncbi:MAG: hypothetical protein DYG90_07870 [Chloroflexi bacterium CFX6]|nr:hypothetical protein [Chloroflexi bacterium CFX6]